MRRGLRRWCAAWLLALALPLQAAGFTLSAQPGFNLSRELEYLPDPQGQLTLDDVLQPQNQSRFRRVAPFGPGANFGFSRSAYWLRVTLEVPQGLPTRWLLEIAYPPLDQVEVFAPGGASGWLRQVGGDALPFAHRAIPHRNHVFPVDLAPGTTSTIYLRLQSNSTLSAPVHLWQPDALWAHDQSAYATFSLYFGLMMGLLLYNLLLFLSVRESAYLTYAAFVATMGLAQAALSGFGPQFLWPQWTSFNTVSVAAGLTTTAIFGLMFARSFLASAARMPRLDKLLLAQMAGWAVSALDGSTPRLCSDRVTTPSSSSAHAVKNQRAPG